MVRTVYQALGSRNYLFPGKYYYSISELGVTVLLTLGKPESELLVILIVHDKFPLQVALA